MNGLNVGKYFLVPYGKTIPDSITVWADIARYAAYRLGTKIFGPKTRAARFYEFVDREFVVSTSYGRFLCRRGYNDIDAVRESTDPRLLSLIRKLVRKNCVFVDIGAHIGKYSVLAGRLGARVIAFEPDLRNFKSLEENTKLNGLEKRTKLMKCAAYDKNSRTKLFLFEKNSVLSSVKVKGKKYCLVKTAKLDDIIRRLKIKQIDILKVDVEGAEMNILRGAKESIKKGIIKKIIFESWKENYPASKKYLEKSGYRIKKITCRDYLACKTNDGVRIKK